MIIICLIFKVHSLNIKVILIGFYNFMQIMLINYRIIKTKFIKKQIKIIRSMFSFKLTFEVRGNDIVYL